VRVLQLHGSLYRSFLDDPNRMNTPLHCHPERSEGSGLRAKNVFYRPDSSLHCAALRMTLSHFVRRSSILYCLFLDVLPEPVENLVLDLHGFPVIISEPLVLT